MKIEVTQEDIDEGVPNSCAYCPIARAVSRVTGRRVSTGYRFLGFRDKPYDRTIRLPDEASNFAQEFDLGEPVRPFTFDLAL